MDFAVVFNEVIQSADMDLRNSYKLYDTLSRKVVDQDASIITKTIKSDDTSKWMDAEFKHNRSLRRKL